MGIEHVETFEGMPAPADIFQPYMMGVELLLDMDEFFESARRAVESGEYPGEQIQKGQRAVDGSGRDHVVVIEDQEHVPGQCR